VSDKEVIPMIVEFIDAVAGTPVYINPEYVMSMRPDAVDPTGTTEVKLKDGETIRVRGDHERVADRLAATLRPAVAV
jgi:hypothetical protein